MHTWHDSLPQRLGRFFRTFARALNSNNPLLLTAPACEVVDFFDLPDRAFEIFPKGVAAEVIGNDFTFQYDGTYLKVPFKGQTVKFVGVTFRVQNVGKVVIEYVDVEGQTIIKSEELFDGNGVRF